MRHALRQVQGHARTILPQVRARLLGVDAPPAVPWATTLVDPDVGEIQLSGDLRATPGADRLVLLLHGLGGAPDSVYCRQAAAGLASMGYASLSLALRGADLRGEDFYNVGQTADLHAALRSPELAGYRDLHVLGFSMGGHVALHLAAESPDPRVRCVAALCTPLELKSIQEFIDAPARRFYRNHVLAGLKAIYAAVAARQPVPTPVEEVAKVRSIFAWDTLAIAPRYGFRGADHSYEALSVAPRLHHLQLPSLLVAAEDDPMVAADLVRAHLPPPDSGLEVRFAPRAGHVAFAGDLDLGLGPRPGLLGQMVAWFARHESGSDGARRV